VGWLELTTQQLSAIAEIAIPTTRRPVRFTSLVRFYGLHDRGWRIVALDVGLDSSTPSGELVVAALSMAARFEYRRISERQIDKHEELRRQGRPRGREAAPPELADLVRTLRRDGLSFAAIAAELERRKVPTVRGGQRWRPAAVRSVLVTRERELAARAA
jgi:DNA invertase Pin-like site-specific DNA recombinase